MENKQTKILIEVVGNGFIVHEDYYNEDIRVAVAHSKKVYNTKKQLYSYILSNL
jgi:hypothetical protein